MSPVDWQLMEKWESEGVPLRIVLATIDDVFDQIEDDPKRTGSIRTLSYCKDAVESRYRSWLESRVGGAGQEAEEEETVAGPSSAEFESLAKRLETVADEFGEGISRVLKEASESLRGIAEGKHSAAESEAELERLDEAIDSALLEDAESERLAAAKKVVEEEIGARRGSMAEDVWERTEAMMVRKYLRENSGIPRLGLFYL